MTASVTHISNDQAVKVRGKQTGKGSSAAFDNSLVIEQAGVLMRQTDQYAQWQRLSQKSDSRAIQIATTIIDREKLLQKQAMGAPIDLQHFAQLSAQLEQEGISLPVSLDLQVKEHNTTQPRPLSISSPTTSPVQQTPLSSSQNLLSEENLLILSFNVPDVGVSRSILGYGDFQSSMLPLDDISQALDFNITVDPRSGTAAGWYISEDRSFVLDIKTQSITIDGKTSSWSSNQVLAGEDDIYVDSRVLSQWFPLDIEVSRGELSVNVTPREQLPLQLQYEREQERLRLLGKDDMSVKYQLREAPYEWLSFPVVDFSSSIGTGTIRQDSSGDFQQKYSLVAEGDVALMGAQVYLSGLEDDWLNSARIRLSRYDYSSELLGPLNASKILLGDISPIDFPVLGRPSVEKGITLSNSDLSRSDDYDTTRFEGNMQPGWDVELYRNSVLIQSARVGVDGRYLFDEVPVYFGKNDFVVKAYGPQGQRQVVEEKAVNVGSQMISPGKLEYNFSATQREKTILGIDEGDKNQEGNGGRFSSTFRYGINDRLSATAGISSIEFDNTVHNYLQAGVSGTLSSLYGQADYIYDTASGSGLSLFGQTSLGSVNVTAKHQTFFDFIEEDNPNRPLKSRTELRLNGNVPRYNPFPPLSYSLSGENTAYEGSSTYKIRTGVSALFKYFNLSNENVWTINETTSSSNTKINGNVKAVGMVGKQRLNAGLLYKLGNENEISQYYLDGYWPISQGLSANGNITHYTGGNESTALKMSMNWDAGDFMLSPSLSYETKGGGFGAFLTLSFSLGRDPMSGDFQMDSKRRSGRGAATAFVYHDKNNNQIFDAEDSPLPEVDVVARQARKTRFTNEEGFAHFNDLTAFDPNDIEVDTETLEDPFWAPSADGVAVVPRAGQVNNVEVPIVTTGEIDGTLYTLDSNGVREVVSGVQLEVVAEDGEVVKTVTSEYDGFYLFEKVFPGTYTLRIATDDPHVDSLVEIAPIEINIGTDGTISSGNDIIINVSATQAKTAPPPDLNRDAPVSVAQDTHKISEPVVVTSEKSPPVETPTAPTQERLMAVEQYDRTDQQVMVNTSNEPIQAQESISPTLASSIIVRPLSEQAGRDLKPEQKSIAEGGASTITIRPLTTRSGSGSNSPSLLLPQSSMATVSAPALRLVNDKQRPEKVDDVPQVSKRERNQPANQSGQPVAANPSPVGRLFDPILKQDGRIFDPFFSTSRVPRRPQIIQSIANQGQQISRLAQRYGDNTEYHDGRINGNTTYGVHLASYRTREAAERGLGVLSGRLKDLVDNNNFMIAKVDLGSEKGIWYRVVYGRLEQQGDAEKLAKSIQPKTEYARSIAVEGLQGTGFVAAPSAKKRLTSNAPRAADIVQKYTLMQQKG